MSAPAAPKKKSAAPTPAAKAARPAAPKPAPAVPKAPPAATTAARKPAKKRVRRATAGGRQVRLALGTAFLLGGVFLGLSIVSYYFTWRADQDLFLSSTTVADFVLRGTAPVANWCGRLGAAAAHILVYRGAGLASGAVALWAGAIGVHLIYGRRGVPVMRYLRWLALVLLVAAPILTYLFPKSAFPWGGALGSEAVAYGNGLLGAVGTGAALLAGALFVVFVIFSLDVTPVLSRWRSRVRQKRAALRTARQERREAAAVAAAPAPVLERGAAAVSPAAHAEAVVALEERAVQDAEGGLRATGINTEVQPLSHVDDGVDGNAKSYDLSLGEKPPVAVSSGAALALAATAPEGADTSAFLVEEAAGGTTPDAIAAVEEAAANASQSLRATPGAGTLTFEVVTQVEEAPAPEAIRHGAHISVESGEPYAPELDLPDYRFPTLDLLEERSTEKVALDTTELEQNKSQIIQTLRSFGIEIHSIKATVGPTVTLYEIIPAEGVRISKIRNLEDDIALALSALGIRIIAPIPGKGTIGIEVPNANKQIVSMQALLASDKFVHSRMSLPIALGKTISNENYIVDLATMPHLLMAGATGQGKSVGINAILVSLLYKKHPSQLKFVLVDPKKVELSIYRTIEKHFLAKLPNEEEAIITDTKKVIYTLNALCIEMDNRYELLKEAGARNIKEYNDKFIARRLNPERGHKFLPFIVLVVDEFADLIMTAGKEVEMPIARLAQLARAVGIHLIIATQRPSVNVITGTIKANFPGRVAFKVSAKVDSRTILDAGGAEQLVGRGDMLVSHGSELLRVQCAFVDTPEVERVADFIGKQRGYPTAFELPEYEGEDSDSEKAVVDLQNKDKLFDDCARVVVQTQSGSTSMLQRRFNLGYNRAGRIMDQLEAASIVGPAVGSKPREVLYHTEAELEGFLQTLG